MLLVGSHLQGPVGVRQLAGTVCYRQMVRRRLSVAGIYGIVYNMVSCRVMTVAY
jgi:hypothetical protein